MSESSGPEDLRRHEETRLRSDCWRLGEVAGRDTLHRHGARHDSIAVATRRNNRGAAATMRLTYGSSQSAHDRPGGDSGCRRVERFRRRSRASSSTLNKPNHDSGTSNASSGGDATVQAGVLVPHDARGHLDDHNRPRAIS